MIENEIQYQVTQAQARKLAQALGEAKAESQEQIPPLLKQAQIDGIESLLSDLQEQLEEYERKSEMKEEEVDIPSEPITESIQVEQRSEEKFKPESKGESPIQKVAQRIRGAKPSHTQTIITDQIELSSAYYEMVGDQSRQSFKLAKWIALMGAVLFALCLVDVALPFSSIGVTYVGIIASTIIQITAGLSYLYNKASAQLVHFQVYLDRINRAAISHAMCDELEDQTSKQEMVVSIVRELLKKEG